MRPPARPHRRPARHRQRRRRRPPLPCPRQRRRASHPLRSRRASPASSPRSPSRWPSSASSPTRRRPRRVSRTPRAASASGVFAVPEQAPAAPAAAPLEAAADAATGGSGPNPYPGDDAPKEQIAAWMAREAEKRGLPPQLPVMAALVESNLTNVDFGDADSLGYFQMRVSFWDQGEYAGFADDPDKQIDWFLDQAEAVKAQRVSRGQSVDRPGPVRRVDRRRRTPRRAVPRPLPAPPRRGRRAPQGARRRPHPWPRPRPWLRRRRWRMRRRRRARSGPRTSTRRPSGQEGTGGKPTPEGLALLENKNIVFDDVGVSDIKAGKIDPRVIGVLTKLSQEHKITVSCMCSDHDKFTAGGSVSNHSFGRGLDIAAIDGEIVSPSSPLAREIASELSTFDPSIRPDEIGSPFAINGPGYFTDAAHMNHVHVGFKTELSRRLRAPRRTRRRRRRPPPHPPPPRPGRTGRAGDRAAQGRVRRLRRRRQARRPSSAPLASAAAGREAAAGSGVFAVPEQQPARAAAPAEAAAAAAAAPAGPTAYPGRRRAQGADRRLDGRRGGEARLPRPAARHGRARRVQPHQRRLRRRRLARLLPDARLDLGEQVPGLRRATPRSRSTGSSTRPRPSRPSASPAASPSTDPGQFGEWIADVERPAEQFRGRYQLRLDEADALLEARPTPRPRRPEPPPRPAGADAVADAAPPAVARQAGPKALAALRRRRSTRARRTGGAARRRRPASTARASSNGPTRRWASRSRG